ncbi:MAG TPA: carbohydrate ABC transporter permease [Candidatus Saccharimonadales bacterium]|nr:carbohydrate ABC transporter permease [Candidatus Saccharimonadales bacterium]
MKSHPSALTRALTRTPIHLALLLIGTIWLIPTVGLFITSFRERADIHADGWWNVIREPRFTAETYVTMLTSTGQTESLLQNFINSFIITIPATIIPVVLAAAAAYAFAWLEFRGRDVLFLAVVALLVIPIQMTFVPVLQLFNATKLTGNFVGIWLAHSAYGLPFAIYLLHSFFAGLPRSLIEAARMDGSSELRTFLRIVLPLSVPGIASLAIFQFLGVWNDLLVAIIYLQNPVLQPMTVGVLKLLGTYGTEYGVLSAAAFLTMAVPLLVFFSLQRFFVQGLLAGSVKS